MSAMKLAIMGVGGRMGRALVQAVHEREDCVVAGGIEPPGSPHIGADIGTLAGLAPLETHVTDDALSLVSQVDGLLDFTSPQASVAFAELAAQARIAHIIGTTGFTAEDEAKLEAAGRHGVLVKAGNMSLGVNLLMALTKRVAAALDEDFDIEIVEMHHRHKVDAPSGTALMLGHAAAEGRGIDLEERSIHERHGITGARPKGDIGFACIRGGGIIGDHNVIFASESERIELAHKAEDRSVFARGAVKAALWGRGKEPGLYSMLDVLGL